VIPVTTNCLAAPSWNGEVDEGVKLAERVLQVDKNDSIARLVRECEDEVAEQRASQIDVAVARA